MVRLRVAAFALLLVPALASAQRKKMGDVPDPWNDIKRQSDAGIKLSVRDVEEMSPIKLFVDKRRDLKLTDDQLKQIKDIDGKLRETNKPLLKMLDSLKSESKPKAATANNVLSEDEARTQAVMNDFMAVLGSVKTNYDASLKEAMALLDASAQQPKAQELLAKLAKDVDETMKDKMGGRGMMAGAEGGARGRGRP